MRFAIRWVAALVIPAMLLTGSFATAQKKADKDKDKDKDANSEKMIKAGILTGSLAMVYEEKRTLRLQVAVPTINPGAMLSIQQAQVQMLQARASRNPAAMMQAQQTMARAQATMYTTKMQDVELQVQDDVVVRTA